MRLRLGDHGPPVMLGGAGNGCRRRELASKPASRPSLRGIPVHPSTGVFLKFILWLYSWHMEVPGPLIKSELQLQQCRMFKSTLPDWGWNPCLCCKPSRCSQILNPLRHSRNSTNGFYFILFYFIFFFCLLLLLLLLLLFLGPLPRHMEVPRLGVESEL